MKAIKLRDLFLGGRGTELREVFSAIRQTTVFGDKPKYSMRLCSWVEWRIISRSYSGPVLQLCHLVNALGSCAKGRESYEKIFFGPGMSTSTHYKSLIIEHVGEGSSDSCGPVLTNSGLLIRYSEGEFHIDFSYMPYLTCLLEFLMTAVSYTNIDQIFQKMLGPPFSEDSVNKAASQIQREIYAYLSPLLPSAHNKWKFEQMLAFDGVEPEGAYLDVDDNTILEFWRQYSTENGEFKSYRTVVDSYVDLVRALKQCAEQATLEEAAPIGLDRSAGEVNPAVQHAKANAEDYPVRDAVLEISGEEPVFLDALAQHPVSKIKFLNSREKNDLHNILRYGKEAFDFPMSVLRLDVFGKMQMRISQALRRKENLKNVAVLARANQDDNYCNLRSQYEDRYAQIQRVQKATLYVLSQSFEGSFPDDRVVPVANSGHYESPFVKEFESEVSRDFEELEAIREECAREFQKINRQGFRNQDIQNYEVIEGFKEGAGIMVAIGQHVVRFIQAFDEMGPNNYEGLKTVFCSDQKIFEGQFDLLYELPQ